MTLSDLIQILFRASQQEHGLLLKVSDPRRAREAFLRARESEEAGELPPVKIREIEGGNPEGGNLALLRVRGKGEEEEDS